MISDTWDTCCPECERPSKECDCDSCKDQLFSFVSCEVVANSHCHSQSVLDWRQSEFRRLGFKAITADYLGKTRIDIHQMEALLKAGCQHELALQILIGTDWHGDDPDPYVERAHDRS